MATYTIQNRKYHNRRRTDNHNIDVRIDYLNVDKNR